MTDFAILSTLVMSALNGAVASAGAAFACKRLEGLLSRTSPGGEVTTYLDENDGPTYQERVQFSYYPHCWQNASCIVSPSSNEELAQVVTIIRETKTDFAIRSGGHSFNKGASSIDHSGVLIDMVNFDHIELSEDKKSCRIGAAAAWGDVYKKLDGTGVIVNGGRHTAPNAAGQTLGGGIGWFVNRLGITAAGLDSIEIMLSDSKLVIASETENPDLFWAIKGGGSNFGIVTSLTYRTLPVDKIWYEVRVYDRAQNSALVDALYEHQLATADNPNIHCVPLFLELDTPASFVGFVSYDAEPQPEAFKQFYDIPYVAHMAQPTIGTPAQLSQTFSATVARMRMTAYSTPFKLNREVYNTALEALKEAQAQAAAINGTLTLVSQPFTPYMVEQSESRGGNPLALEKVLQDWFAVTIAWTDESHDSEANRIAAEVASEIQKSAKDNGANLQYIFANDASEKQDVLSSCSSKNVGEMRKVSQKYDRCQMFQNQQKGGWLLGRVPKDI